MITDTREKYKLSIENREELTKIAMHEGWDKAFHRLMEIAVEPEEVIENPLSYNFELQAKRWFEKLQVSLTAYISVIERYDFCSRRIAEIESSATDDPSLEAYKSAMESQDAWLKSKSSDVDYNKITDTLTNFDFNYLLGDIIALCSHQNVVCTTKVEDLIRDAIYVLVAAKDFWEKEHEGSFFCIGGMYAIVVPDEDTCFYKLIYSLEESKVEW